MLNFYYSRVMDNSRAQGYTGWSGKIFAYFALLLTLKVYYSRVMTLGPRKKLIL